MDLGVGLDAWHDMLVLDGRRVFPRFWDRFNVFYVAMQTKLFKQSRIVIYGTQTQ